MVRARVKARRLESGLELGLGGLERESRARFRVGDRARFRAGDRAICLGVGTIAKLRCPICHLIPLGLDRPPN